MKNCEHCGGLYDELEYNECPYCTGELDDLYCDQRCPHCGCAIYKGECIYCGYGTNSQDYFGFVHVEKPKPLIQDRSPHSPLVDDELAIAYAEVYTVFQHIYQEELDLIPEEIWQVIDEYRDKSASLTFEMMGQEIFMKQMSKSAKEVFLGLYKNYIASESEKNAIEQMLKENEGIN